ncbi:MAG: tetratricopeptide repeat protein, partial [Chitinophagaceae bacterium]|nr:tetratricopeptide repeat protein [Chitinophagaceae bacterium]
YQNKLKIHDLSFSEQEAIIDGLRSFGKKNNDESLVAEASLAAAWRQSLQSPAGKLVTSAMEEFIADRTKEKDFVSVARAWRMLGDLYLQKNEDYETTLECYFKNIETGNRLAEDVYPERMYDFFSISNVYYQFKEYRQALGNLRLALSYRPPHKMAVVQSNIRNTLGLCYQKTGNLDSSDYYFYQVLQHETDRHEEWRGIAMGNLGYNYFLRGNYPKAIEMLEQDIAIATKYHQRENSCKSFIWLATMYLRQNNIAKAEEMAGEAQRAIISKNFFDQYEFLYPLLSKLNAAKGNFAKSDAYLDSALWAKDSVERKFNAMQLARAEQKAESVKKQQQLASLDAERRNKTLQRNILIGFLLLLSGIAIYIFRLVKRRHKQEQLVKDLQLEKKETALSTAQQQLKDFSENFHQKALLLEQLESRLQVKGAEDTELLEQLRQSTLLTDEQW